LQVFSRDNVLQLVSNLVISLLLKYSNGESSNEWLSSLIPALEMIFINIFIIEIDKEPIDTSELRRLSGILVHHATFIFNNLVQKRDIFRAFMQSPESLSRDWEDNENFYDRSFIHRRFYYEERDNDRNIDKAKTDQCKKYYSIYDKQNLIDEFMTIWCSHLIYLDFHLIPRVEERNDVFSVLYVYFE